MQQQPQVYPQAAAIRQGYRHLTSQLRVACPQALACSKCAPHQDKPALSTEQLGLYYDH
jgi:hypothetical protein